MKVLPCSLLVATFTVLLTQESDLDSLALSFPENFKFGAASSSYQVEGAWNEDGKGPSIWDTFTHDHPELIADRSNGDTSANSYHFYMNDIEALQQVGVSELKTTKRGIFQVRIRIFASSFIIIGFHSPGLAFSPMERY